jgi:hypothetical protein
MMLPRYLVATAVAVVFVMPPSEARGQDPDIQTPPTGNAELVYDREVFQYPEFTRKNPFVALDGAMGGGPRFEQMSLIGVMYSPDGNSVAVLSTGGVQVAEDGTTTPIDGDSYNMKVGDSIGNTTVIEIRRDAVIVDVEVFDAVERHTMTFVSRLQGGTP